MQFKFFNIPAIDSETFENELNLFLRTHRVLKVSREFVSCGERIFWACCVEYLDSPSASFSGTVFGGSAKKKVDYRELLNDAQFLRFRKLREARKVLSKSEAVPAYAIFLDAQLAELAKIEDELSLTKLKSIDGFGEGKCERWGEAFLKILSDQKEISSRDETGE